MKSNILSKIIRAVILMSPFSLPKTSVDARPANAEIHDVEIEVLRARLDKERMAYLMLMSGRLF
ncbi:hypothetical protein AZI86_10620 [Bdellovibrio bacteriovorus]|uniref:Uncharacterized protein n=1 Tax=Bdellovibrio bacteriovorus TaxID=959 RepID=A0A150WL02_BDEBC|nr:hypothetical protein [Bdellovibrio bacteriovorus]KYG64660.1 hypothetical protein AZI86_10620 [Bdellovibrio bacteriovorus]